MESLWFKERSTCLVEVDAAVSRVGRGLGEERVIDDEGRAPMRAMPAALCDKGRILPAPSRENRTCA